MSSESSKIESPPSQWYVYFIEHYKDAYNDLKQYDRHELLSLDNNKLENEFALNFKTGHDLIKKRVAKPDRHKAIALLTKAFLDASPFTSDLEKAKALLRKDENIQKSLVFPNEYFAIDICSSILDAHIYATQICNEANFMFPQHTYVHTDRIEGSDYKAELYFLYRHYLARKAKRDGKFSIFQTAHIYFLLEMGCEIANYNLRDLYYD